MGVVRQRVQRRLDVVQQPGLLLRIIPQPEAVHGLRQRCFETGHVCRGQLVAVEFQQADGDFVQIDAGQFEHLPIDERGDRATTIPLGHDHYLAAESPDGESAYALLAELNPRAHPGGSRRRVALQLRLGGDGEPRLLEGLAVHPDTVVAHHEEVVHAVEVGYRCGRVSVMGVLVQFAERSRKVRDLLPSQHVDRSGPCPERSHAACLATLRVPESLSEPRPCALRVPTSVYVAACSIRCRPKCRASTTGTALPICFAFDARLPENWNSVGKVCSRAASRTLSARSWSG